MVLIIPVPIKSNCSKEVKKLDKEKQKAIKTPVPLQKSKQPLSTNSKDAETQSQCSSVLSIKSLVMVTVSIT